MITGFGITFDISTGVSRHWYYGSDGVKRWVDNDEPRTPVPIAEDPNEGVNEI